jgi:transcriptional regulator with XRE-family HTH domain
MEAKTPDRQRWLRSKKPGTYLLPGLKRIREEKDLSIRALAKKARVAPDTVWKVERCERGAESRTRRKLALALGVPIRELSIPDEEVEDE